MSARERFGRRLRVAIAAAGGLLGCAPIPRTRAEFVTAVSQGGAFYSTETLKSSSSLDALTAMLETRSEQCLARQVTETASDGTTATKTYLPTVERVRPDLTELTLKERDFPAGLGVPEDGLFLLAADATATAKGTTSTLYVWSMTSDETHAAIRAWLSGENAPCPDLD